MNSLIKYISVFFAVCLCGSHCITAQTKASLRADEIPGWVFGYVTDEESGEPVEGVYVWAYDSESTAGRYSQVVNGRKSPASVNMGGVIETCTDKAGRYMIPVLRDGTLLFFFPDSGRTLVENVCRRYSVNVGKEPPQRIGPEKRNARTIAVDTSGIVRPRRTAPAGTRFNFDFNYCFPYRTDYADVRLVVERNVVDVLSGDTLSSVVPVVLDGRSYHRKQRRLIAKGEASDSLYNIAEKCKELTDTTFFVKVRDAFDAGQWMSKCFMISYLVKIDKGTSEEYLDTLPMMMNRISRPFQFLECPSVPYAVADSDYPVSRRPGKRTLTVTVNGETKIPEVLMQDDYVLKKISVKAVVAPSGDYRADLDEAGLTARATLSGIRSSMSSKISDGVRTTMFSEVSDDPRIECRYEFDTYRKFVPDEYHASFDAAVSREELEYLYTCAIEESELLDGRRWFFASNGLASSYMERGYADTTVLAPFVNGRYPGCNDEILANQVMIKMMAQDYAGAEALSVRLPEKYATLRAIARCKCSMVDFDDPMEAGTIELLRNSSLRNKVVMDLLLGMDDTTSEALAALPQDEAETFYLKAQRLCLMYHNVASLLRSGTFDSSEDLSLLREGETVISAYDAVVRYLIRCLELDESLKAVAARDADINDEALKDAVGQIML